MNVTEQDPPDWSQFVMRVGWTLRLLLGILDRLKKGKYAERMAKKFGECFDQYEDIHVAMEPFFNDEQKGRMEKIENHLLSIVGLIEMRGMEDAFAQKLEEAEKKLAQIIWDLQNPNPVIGSLKRNRVLAESNESLNFKMPRLGERPREYEYEVDMENLFGVESEQESGTGMEDNDASDSEQDTSQPSTSTPKIANKDRSVRRSAKSGKRSKRFSSNPSKKTKAANERKEIFLEMQKRLGLENIERKTASEAKNDAAFWNAIAFQLSLFKGKTEEEIAALPAEVKEYFDKIRNEHSEKRCSSQEISPEVANQYAELFKDYRNLDGTFKDIFFSVHPEDQEELASPPALPSTIKFATKLHLPPDTAGKDIIQTVQDGKTVYSSATEGTLLFDDENLNFVKKELEFYKEKGINCGKETDTTQVRISTPVIDAMSIKEDDLEKAMLSFPICVIENIKEAWGLDGKLFEISALKRRIDEIGEKVDVDVNLQFPQPTTSNFNLDLNPKLKQFSNQMLIFNTKSVPKGLMTFDKFGENYNKLRTETQKAFDKLVANVEDHENIMEEFGKELKKIAFPLVFLTNFDLNSDAQFSEQIASTSRMPRFLQPFGHGGLLDYPGEIISGLNRPQLYIKPPGARTTPHLENNGLTSINISFGEGDCIWFAVPFEFSARFEKFIKDRFKLEYDGKLDLETIFYHMHYWPNEFELLHAGIPLLKFVQKPYQMVFVNYGTYHWVQSNGFCTNFSWNVAQNNYLQLATACLTHDHFTNMGKQAMMPIEHTVWTMVEKKVKVEKKLFDLIKTILMRSIAHAEEERLYLQKHNIEVEEPPEEVELLSVERCAGPGCKEEVKKIVFNYVAMKDDTTFCLECYSKESEKDREGFVVYEIREIETLVDLYDNYKFETLVDQTDG